MVQYLSLNHKKKSSLTHMLQHSQLAFYEQARCLFHNKIYILWNRPESLLLTMVQDISFKGL
ncbi:hypothetical protein D0A37_20170 [Microcoleus vaginatus HSN003]|nr:hypothetical protein D0A37_20170 [Microcoleus vaginatus HSN003]